MTHKLWRRMTVYHLLTLLLETNRYLGNESRHISDPQHVLAVHNVEELP